MKKVAFQIIIFLAVFYAGWFVLSQVDWMTLLKIEKATKSTEQKIGDLFWDMIDKSEKVILNKDIIDPMDSLLTKICISNGIDKSNVKLHIVENNEINAFALPNRHLVVYTGLIKAAESEEEICGVLSHELAHMELDHVMKKLVKEVGLSVLISISSGNGGSGTSRKIVKMLSSSAYDRNLEKEADMKAVDYLVKAQINPEPFANFLYRLASSNSNVNSGLSWISTHPDSKERAENIVQKIKTEPVKYGPVLNPSTWEHLKQCMKDF